MARDNTQLVLPHHCALTAERMRAPQHRMQSIQERRNGDHHIQAATVNVNYEWVKYGQMDMDYGAW